MGVTAFEISILIFIAILALSVSLTMVVKVYENYTALAGKREYRKLCDEYEWLDELVRVCIRNKLHRWEKLPLVYNEGAILRIEYIRSHRDIVGYHDPKGLMIARAITLTLSNTFNPVSTLHLWEMVNRLGFYEDESLLVADPDGSLYTLATHEGFLALASLGHVGTELTYHANGRHLRLRRVISEPTPDLSHVGCLIHELNEIGLHPVICGRFVGFRSPKSDQTHPTSPVYLANAIVDLRHDHDD